MPQPLVVEGEMILWEIEGGFVPCQICIEEQSLDRVIAAYLGVSGERSFGLKNTESHNAGRVRCTIEFLEDV